MNGPRKYQQNVAAFTSKKVSLTFVYVNEKERVQGKYCQRFFILQIMMVACMTQQGLNLTFDIKNKAENIALLVCFHFVSDMSVLSLLLSILLNLIGKLW